MIKIINKADDRIVLKTDLSPSTANAIRRSVNLIPILAIESLEISKNDSALYDEIIAHRSGLVPIKNEDLKLPEECDCGKEDGCGKCSIKLKLSAKGPCTVYSTDMSPKNVVLYKMPLTILDKDQELEFVAVARTGKGIKHAKFSPGIIYYRYSEDLEKEDDESFKKILEESKKDNGKELTMIIESWGQINAKDMMIDSINILNKEIKDLIKEIK
jgi:DNA-directed RNA polymerase subunit D